ncbi:hypothetical protein ACFLZX_05930 [Nanoarchaeota archaeon]
MKIKGIKMKVPEEDLQKIKSTKKWIYQQVPSHLITISIPMRAFTVILGEVQKELGFALSVGYSNGKDGNFYPTFGEKDFHIRGEWMEKHSKEVHGHYKEWCNRVKEFYSFVKKIDENDPDLLDKYDKFEDLYANQWGVALMTEYNTVWGDIIVKRMENKGYSPELINTLILQDKLSFHMEEEKDLLEIFTKYGFKLPNKCPHELEEHAKKYFWLEGGYNIQKRLSPSDFSERLKEYTPDKAKKRLEEIKNYEESVKKRKKEAVEKLKLSKEEELALRDVGFIGWWQDQRKRANLIGMYYQFAFIKKAC